MVRKPRKQDEASKASSLNPNVKVFTPVKKEPYKPYKDKETGVYVYTDKEGNPFQSSLDTVNAYKEGMSRYRNIRMLSKEQDNYDNEDNLVVSQNSGYKSAAKGR